LHLRSAPPGCRAFATGDDTAIVVVMRRSQQSQQLSSGRHVCAASHEPRAAGLAPLRPPPSHGPPGKCAWTIDLAKRGLTHLATCLPRRCSSMAPDAGRGLSLELLTLFPRGYLCYLSSAPEYSYSRIRIYSIAVPTYMQGPKILQGPLLHWLWDLPRPVLSIAIF
jgi:hypothetical protein